MDGQAAPRATGWAGDGLFRMVRVEGETADRGEVWQTVPAGDRTYVYVRAI